MTVTPFLPESLGCQSRWGLSGLCRWVKRSSHTLLDQKHFSVVFGAVGGRYPTSAPIYAEGPRVSLASHAVLEE